MYVKAVYISVAAGSQDLRIWYGSRYFISWQSTFGESGSCACRRDGERSPLAHGPYQCTTGIKTECYWQCYDVYRPYGHTLWLNAQFSEFPLVFHFFLFTTCLWRILPRPVLLSKCVNKYKSKMHLWNIPKKCTAHLLNSALKYKLLYGTNRWLLWLSFAEKHIFKNMFLLGLSSTVAYVSLRIRLEFSVTTLWLVIKCDEKKKFDLFFTYTALWVLAAAKAVNNVSHNII